MPQFGRIFPVWAGWCIPLRESISTILWRDRIVSFLLHQPTGNLEHLVTSQMIIRKGGQKSNGPVPSLLKNRKQLSGWSIFAGCEKLKFSSLFCMQVLEPRTPSPKEVLYQAPWQSTSQAVATHSVGVAAFCMLSYSIRSETPQHQRRNF